jgi:O-succinylbenzoic acid--CoA ligase
MDLDTFLTQWHNDSPLIAVHTSGSTGKPKAMMVEKRRMLASAKITCDFLHLTADDTALLCMSLDYIGAKMVVVRSIERSMHLVTVPPSGHPYTALTEEWRKPGRITFAAMVPLQVYNALQVPEERAWLMSIRNLIIGGGAIDDQLAEALKSFPNHVWSTYGMTETLSHIALRPLSGPQVSEWYQPFPSVKVSTDAEGCLVIDAPLVHEGQLVTHDRAEIIEGKGFRILGRKDNVIVSGGIKIQIEEVEKQLRPHLHEPFLVTKAKHEKFGEEVVLLTESADLDAAEAVCRRVLPKYWQPRRYVHVERLPLTPNGKPARKEAEKVASTVSPEGLRLSSKPERCR